MSRVEPIEKSSGRRGADQARQAEQGRTNIERADSSGPGATPGKAEGEERDVDEALRQKD